MTKKISRRDFVKATAVGSGAVLLAACAPAAAPPTAVPTAVPAAPAMSLPFPMDAAAMNPLGIGTEPIDGVFFSGGFGHDYITYAGKLVEGVHPGVKVSVKPIQKVSEELRPRLVEGNPPDVIDNSGAGSFPTTDLVNEGQLADLTALMEAPSFDTPGVKFKDTLFPGSQSSLVYDGPPPRALVGRRAHAAARADPRPA